jgi:GDPmannose 4,6-dehydratase
MKRVLITGITSQDGAYLAKNLLEKGVKIFGTKRINSNLWRLEKLKIKDDIQFIDFYLNEQSTICEIIEKIYPDAVYNLAAQSFIKTSFDLPIHTAQVNALAVSYMLEAIRKINGKIKFYQASTSEMFGKTLSIPQNESTAFYPRNPYGVAKLYAYWMTKNYREYYNMHSCSGILFNHESCLRGEEFVTRKITLSLSRIKQNKQDFFEIGNVDARRDWGFAGDYVEAMRLMLETNKPDDYVIATNQTHSVREFIEKAAKFVDIDVEWYGQKEHEIGINKNNGKVIIKVNPVYYRPIEDEWLVGDYSKAKIDLGWQPKMSFDALIEHMMLEDLKNYCD